jgi:hypothetical protein
MLYRRGGSVRKSKKKPQVKRTKCKIWEGEEWVVQRGILNAGRGAAGKVKRLFRVVGEKLPFDAIDAVDEQVRSHTIQREGVYIAHDSMGYSRYIGRGKVFPRLRACRDNHREVMYFSFYLVDKKKHEREIETLLIHAAGSLLQFNTKKKRTTLSAGSILDYEAGTEFFERHSKKGKKPRE